MYVTVDNGIIINHFKSKKDNCDTEYKRGNNRFYTYTRRLGMTFDMMECRTVAPYSGRAMIFCCWDCAEGTETAP